MKRRRGEWSGASSVMRVIFTSIGCAVWLIRPRAISCESRTGELVRREMEWNFSGSIRVDSS
jgi:hypothetical protein